MRLSDEHQCSCGSVLPQNNLQLWHGSFVCNYCFAKGIREYAEQQDNERLADEQQAGVQMLFAAGVGVMLSMIVITLCVGAWM